MKDEGSGLAERLRPLIASYCQRPAVRHELGLAEGTSLEATLLAHGANHLNYLVQARDGRRWVARLSTGSQLGLSSAKQIAYEARVLRFLEPFHIAPQLCYVDATLYQLPYGCLIMEYLPGGPLDAHNGAHLLQAAQLLARLHSIPIPEDSEFIRNLAPLSAIVTEAERLQGIYDASPVAQVAVTRLLGDALHAARGALVNEARFHATCLVHNDLQVYNWIVAPPRPATLPMAGLLPIGSVKPMLRLVDWAKPMLDDPTADLCHFLLSLPTREQVDHIFSSAEQEAFLQAYLRARPEIDAADLRERVAIRMQFVYLRTVSWCAFAQAESTGTSDVNTFRMTAEYLDPSRIRLILGDWIRS